MTLGKIKKRCSSSDSYRRHNRLGLILRRSQLIADRSIWVMFARFIISHWKKPEFPMSENSMNNDNISNTVYRYSTKNYSNIYGVKFHSENYNSHPCCLLTCTFIIFLLSASYYQGWGRLDELVCLWMWLVNLQSSIIFFMYVYIFKIYIFL